MIWQPIETFPPEDWPYWESEYDKDPKKTKYYDSALVFGPTWEGGGDHDYPLVGGAFWVGEPIVAIARTYSGEGFWTIDSDAPCDYDTYIQPTHWMPCPEPPK